VAEDRVPCLRACNAGARVLRSRGVNPGGPGNGQEPAIAQSGCPIGRLRPDAAYPDRDMRLCRTTGQRDVLELRKAATMGEALVVEQTAHGVQVIFRHGKACL
jgi:hypothetical protein